MHAQTFSTPQEEVTFLRKALEDKQQEVDELENNFADFQQFSKQLEDEMEQELQATEKKHAEMESKYKRLRDDYEKLMDKSSTQSKESSLLISTLQEELNKVTQQRNSLQKDLRRLEQENDTLERRERMLTTSVADMQERLEKVMEENVWVQSELDEQSAQADESVQRLRDEIRDLKLEIAIMEQKKSSTPRGETSMPSPVKLEIPIPTITIETPTRPPKSPRRNPGTPSSNAPPLAIGMVSDMLNLVKELEVRIASYKSNKNLLSPPASPRLDPQALRQKHSYSTPELPKALEVPNPTNNSITNADGADIQRVPSVGSDTGSAASENLSTMKNDEVPTS